MIKITGDDKHYSDEEKIEMFEKLSRHLSTMEDVSLSEDNCNSQKSSSVNC